MAWFPCGCCNCPRFSDDFDRANSGSLGGDWTDPGSNWGIVSNKAENPNPIAAEAIAYHTPTTPLANGDYVKFTFNLTTNGDLIGAALCVEDENNFLLGEAQAGTVASDCGTIRLYTVSSGTRTQTGRNIPVEGLVVGLDHTLEVCFEPDEPGYDGAGQGKLTVKVTTNDGHVVSYSRDVTPSAANLGGRVGFTSELITNANEVEINDFDNEELGIETQSGDACPHCGIGCTIASDDFNRATLGSCEWTQKTGTWSISSNALTVTTSGLIINEYPHPGTASRGYPQYASVIGQGSADNTKLQLIFDYVDNNNYHFIQVEVGSENGAADGTLSLWHRDGGSDNQLGSDTTVTGAANSTNVTISGCLNNGIFEGTATTGTPASIEEATTAEGGDRAGIGLASGGTGTFDDFSFKQLKDDGDLASCPDCITAQSDCDCCIDGDRPTALLVRIAGVVFNSATPFQCGFPGMQIVGCCGDINASHVVEPGAYVVNDQSLFGNVSYMLETCDNPDPFTSGFGIVPADCVYTKESTVTTADGQCLYVIKVGVRCLSADQANQQMDLMCEIIQYYKCTNQFAGGFPPPSFFPIGYAGFRRILDGVDPEIDIDCMALNNVALSLVCESSFHGVISQAANRMCDFSAASVSITAI